MPHCVACQGDENPVGALMKLSRTVDYALRATVLLAQTESPRPIPCSQLAKQGEMPERFLLQILRSLVTHGILRSTRGVDGGYTLIRPAESVSLLEIIEAIEGPINGKGNSGESISLGPVDPNADAEQKLREALRDISTVLRQQLDAIKISHLLPSPSDR